MRTWFQLLLCAFTLALLSLGCSKTPELCKGELSTLTLNPTGSNCDQNCECNNYLYTGSCVEKLCKSIKRSPCDVKGEKQTCILPDYAATGTCKNGVRECQPDELDAYRYWGDCRPSTANQQENTADLCTDGIDNDCDGKVDTADTDCKGFCIPGAAAAVCYTGPDGTLNEGLCTSGLQACDETTKKWGACARQVVPVDEVCDKKDNDCDGLIDEDLKDCPAILCTLSEQRDCYNNLFGCTPGQGKFTCRGLCKAGYRECQAKDGSVAWSSCQRQVAPQNETCDGYDNDCDGEIDEDCPCTDGATQPCYPGTKESETQGSCRKGIQHCLGDRWGPCKDAKTPTIEVCNGQDDDCDGQTDEDLVAPNCDKGGGLCRGVQKVCGGGAGWRPCTDAQYKAASAAYVPDEGKDHCDNIDNDCDGIIDEGCPTDCKAGDQQECYTGPAGTAGIGVCRKGFQTCRGGAWGNCLLEIKPGSEVCNGLDDDCNGKVDDACSAPSDAGNPPEGEPVPERTGTPCTQDSDCAANQQCTNGKCRYECADDRDCTGTKAGFMCKNNKCSPCTKNEDCNNPKQACFSGICKVVQCFYTKDCAEGELCNVQTYTCEGCKTDSDCGSDKCFGGLCRKGCTSDTDCGAGYTCLNKQLCLKKCTASADCPRGSGCYKGSCHAQVVLNSEGAYQWVHGPTPTSCMGYRHPAPGRLPPTNDDRYMIQPTGSTAPFSAFCDFQNRGGGWTLMAHYINNLHLKDYDPTKHQRQVTPTSGDKTVLNAPPKLSSGGVYGHIAYSTFQHDKFELRIECKDTTKTDWFYINDHRFFNKSWKTQIYGVFQKSGSFRIPYELNAGWGVITKTGVLNRRDAPCGGHITTPGDSGISYCTSSNLGGIYATLAGFAFKANPGANDAGLTVLCDRKAYGDLLKQPPWEGRIWIREAGSNPIVSDTNGVRRWKDGTFAPSCKAYLDSQGGQYSGETGSGTYVIKPEANMAAFPVYCDMRRLGGGWTLAFIKNSFGARPNLLPSLDKYVNTKALADAPHEALVDRTSREGWLNLNTGTGLPYTQISYGVFGRPGTKDNCLTSYMDLSPTLRSGCLSLYPPIDKKHMKFPLGKAGLILDKAPDIDGLYRYTWCQGDKTNSACSALPAPQPGTGWFFGRYDFPGTKPPLDQLRLCGSDADTSCSGMSWYYNKTSVLLPYGATDWDAGNRTAIMLWVR